MAPANEQQAAEWPRLYDLITQTLASLGTDDALVDCV